MHADHLVSQVLGNGVAATDVNVPFARGIQDHIIRIHRVIIENMTSNGTVARIGIVRNGQFFTLEYFAAFNANVPQVEDQAGMIIRENEYAQVRLSSTTAADRIEVTFMYSVEPVVFSVA